MKNVRLALLAGTVISGALPLTALALDAVSGTAPVLMAQAEVAPPPAGEEAPKKGERPRRQEGGDAPKGERPQREREGERPQGERPRRQEGERPQGERPQREQRQGGQRSEQPSGEERPQGERPPRPQRQEPAQREAPPSPREAPAPTREAAPPTPREAPAPRDQPPIPSDAAPPSTQRPGAGEAPSRREPRQEQRQDERQDRRERQPDAPPRPDAPPPPSSATPPAPDLAPTQEPRRPPRPDASQRPDAAPDQPPIPPSARPRGDTPPAPGADVPGAPLPDGRPGRPGRDDQGRPDARQDRLQEGRPDDQGRREGRRDGDRGPDKLSDPRQEFREGEARRGGGEFRRFDPERRESRDDDRRDRRLDQEFGRREERQGDRLIIREGDNRVIVREGGRTIIRHDETERLRRGWRDEDVRVDRRNGEVYTVIRRPNGVEIVTVQDDNGRLMRRFRREGGREYMLIDNRPRRPGLSLYLDLAPVQVDLPPEEYIVEADEAGYEDFEEAFTAPPVEPIERAYSLDEVRQNVRLRDRVRSVDVNTINFPFGEYTVPQDQIPQLEGIARAIGAVIEKNPQEVFLIEGHTDAVGSDVDNLSLSDRRAEEVAAILTETYQIPAENLVTQGYGEQYLRVDTEAANADNRRVTVRNITPLLNAQKAQQ